MPGSLGPHGLQPIRLLCPWDFPGKDTGVGCHFLLQGIFPTQGSNPGLLHCRRLLYRLSYKGSPIHKYIHTHSCSVLVLTQSCLSLCDPVDCSLLSSSARGSLQATILEWVAIPFSRGSSQPREPGSLAFQHPRQIL